MGNGSWLHRAQCGRRGDRRRTPPMPRITNGHHKALPYADVADAMKKIRDTSSAVASRLCLEWLVLTAARSGEARGATWQEIDAENRLWIVPAHRMKAGVQHRVPLSDAALAVLENAKAISDVSGLIFPFSAASWLYPGEQHFCESSAKGRTCRQDHDPRS